MMTEKTKKNNNSSEIKRTFYTKSQKKSQQKSPRQFSIRSELILWSVGILLFCMASQVIFTRYTLQSFALRQKEKEMAELMVKLKASYSDEAMDIFNIVEDAQDIENLRIMIYDENHLIYHSASVETSPKRNTPDSYNFASKYERLEPFLQKKYLPLIDFPKRNPLETSNQSPQSTQTDVNMREIDKNVVTLEETFQFNGSDRTILIWSSAVAIDYAVALFVQVNSLVSFFVITVSIFCVVLFSQRFIQPIRNVEKVAESVANLDFSTTAEVNVRTKELSHLANSINLMSLNLEDMIGELHQDKKDLTHKVENQEKLEQMRRQFIANISHEMKTPLTMLMMYCENLKADLPGMDKTFYYDTIIEETVGLNVMVEQLLDTSALENGLSTMNLQPMDFSQFLEELLERLHPLLHDYQVQIQISPQIYIKGDEKYLEQAARNYITNAIAHTEKGQEISISLTHQGDSCTYAVTNQGKPIPEEDLPYLWDSFYRGDKSRTQSGTEKRVGLGLYIVKTCIGSHFGTVRGENTPEGACFSFTLPTISHEEAQNLTSL